MTLYVCMLLTVAAQATSTLDIKVDTAQPEAVLRILEALDANRSVADHDWQVLFATEGHRRLKRREESIKRSLPDEAFREFVQSAALRARTVDLRRVLERWKRADLMASAQRMLAYLPAGARMNATVYPVIKPASNSFVFEPASNPAIFLYLDPSMSDAEFENTVAHELHHIGLSSMQDEYRKTIGSLPANARHAATWLGALGEGLAVLAAAGSLDRHPLADFGADDRARWDRDTTRIGQLFRETNDFLLDVARGGFSQPDVADRVAGILFGFRGHWYTVGYHVGAVVERRFGRQELIAGMRDYRQLIAKYNQAAEELNANGSTPLPLWSNELIAIMLGSR